MIHHILWTMFSLCQSIQARLDETVDLITEKISDFIGVVLWILLCLPFFLIKQFFHFLVDFCKKEKMYRKNVKIFMEWYNEQKKKGEVK